MAINHRLFQYQVKAEPPSFPVAPVAREHWWPHYPDKIDPPKGIHPAHLGYFASGIGFAPVRESQEPVENIFAYATGVLPIRESQEPVEALWQYASGIRVLRASQIVVEIIYPFGCFTFQPPPAGGCPAPNPDAAPTDPACETPTFNSVG